jgi:uncharacterized protein
MFYLLLVIAGCLSGVTTVLFGFGGGFVVVPLLYRMVLAFHGVDGLEARLAMQTAIATSTSVMIVGALLATRRHHVAGHVDWRQVRPLLVPIGAGAALGAWGATLVDGTWLRWAFVAYLAMTLLDACLRPGFVAAPDVSQGPMRRSPAIVAGLPIGAVAACLGVGGSVMTVPMMRRRGASMTAATAMANPLSLPVAIAGTASFVVAGWSSSASLGPGHAGYVDLWAFATLSAGAWAGVRLATPYIGRLPDRLHARVYLGLLALVLLAMVTR